MSKQLYSTNSGLVFSIESGESRSDSTNHIDPNEHYVFVGNYPNPEFEGSPEQCLKWILYTCGPLVTLSRIA